MDSYGSPQFMRHNAGTLEFIPDGSTVAVTVKPAALGYPAGTLALPGLGPKDEPDSGFRYVGAYDHRYVIDETDILKISTSGLDVVGAYYLNGNKFVHNEGTNSAALGVDALYGNSGIASFGGGESAGKNNSGDNLTATGYRSGEDNSGVGCTFDGYLSGWVNSGANVSACGNSSARSNSGSSCFAGGLTALYLNSGSNCVAGGVNSLRQNSGDNQAAWGHETLYQATGGNNFAGGYRSGIFSTAGGCIYLGYYSGRNSVVDNNLYIQNSDTMIPLLGGDFSTKQFRVGGDAVVINPDFLGTEVLTETDFATHANWNTTGDFDDTGGNAAYTHSGGSGTLTQTSGAFSTPLVGNRWYKLVYTSSGVSGDPVATITTGILDVATKLITRSNGTWEALLYTKASPGDFVISVSSTSGALTLDNISLKEIQGGDLWARGDIVSVGKIGAGISAPNYPLQVSGAISGIEKSADPTEPAEGEFIIWMSDGTGKGDDGDVMIASQAGGTTNVGTIFDHSGGAAW